MTLKDLIDVTEPSTTRPSAPPLSPVNTPLTDNEVEQRQHKTKEVKSFASVSAKNNDSWRVQQKPRNRNRQYHNNMKLQLKGAGRATDCPIKGAPEPLRSVFVSRLEHNTSSAELESFLQRKKIDVKEIKQWSHDNAKYKAYKITVPRLNYHDMFSINLWGSGVNVDKFRSRTDQYTPRYNNG